MYCIRCSPYVCVGSKGLISIDMSINSNVTYLDDDECLVGGLSNQFIPGPAVGSITFNAYAFEPGKDKWLGSKCKGSAQASQTNILRYGALEPGGEARYFFIPSKNHKAQLTGDIGADYCSLEKVFYSGKIANSQASNGSSISTEMGTQLGANLSYKGFPLAVTIPNLNSYTISDIVEPTVTAYISSFNVSVDFPNPATVSYTFDFLINNC